MTYVPRGPLQSPRRVLSLQVLAGAAGASAGNPVATGSAVAADSKQELGTDAVVRVSWRKLAQTGAVECAPSGVCPVSAVMARALIWLATAAPNLARQRHE